MWVEIALVIITGALILKLLGAGKPKNDFWEKSGIHSIDISSIASTWELVMGVKNMADVDKIVYNQMGSEKVCGIVEAGTPRLIVKDLDLIKTIIIKDFDYFTDREILFAQSKSRSLQRMLPSLQGSEWRGARVSMSPTFTTGKMRRIMEYFNSCGMEWISYVKKKAEGGPVDIKKAAGQYAIDVIASGVFGLRAGSIQDPNSEFIKMAEKIGDTSYITIFKQSLALRFPTILKLLNLDTFNDSFAPFFESIFSQALRARESGESEARNDFLQLFVEARKGVLKGEGSDELNEFEKEALINEKQKRNYLQDEGIALGSSIIFIIAGYHGIAMSVAYSIHAMAFRSDIQDKLRKEVDGKFSSDGTISYDNLNELTYMDMFVSEILRFYPVTPRINRICTKDYKRPELGLNIPKGTLLEFPVAMIHADPNYYAQPNTFDPEHFNAENKASRNPYAFLAFGHGPRNCIGMRFALVEVKTTLAYLVRNFVIERDAQTPPFPLKTVLVGHGYHIPGQVNVKLIPRNNKPPMRLSDEAMPW